MWHYLRSIAVVTLLAIPALPVLAEDEEAGEDGVVQLDRIAAAVKYNHAAAEERYIGKRLQVQGKALSVQRYKSDKDMPMQYLVMLSPVAMEGYSGVPLPQMPFFFPAKERPGLADIPKDAIVVLEGTCRDQEAGGAALLVRFEDCRLIRILETPMAEATGTAPRTDPRPPTSPTPLRPPMAFPAEP